MKKAVLFLIKLLLGVSLFAQAPRAFQYQAVVRDHSGLVIADKPVFFKISILNGSAAGTVVYRENHIDKATNAFGLVNLEIGKGASELGTFSAINWGSGDYFLKVEIFPSGAAAWQEMGTMQLLSVPYALYAGEVENNNDADADPGNEIQTLGVAGSNLTLSKGGGTVAIPGDGWGPQVVKTNGTLKGQGTEASPLGVDNAANKPLWTNILDVPAGFSDGLDNTEDADSDPANELQALSKTGNVVSLSGNGGGFTDEVDDADHSITNEIQTLAVEGNHLSISGANTVALPVQEGDNWGTQVVKTNSTLTGEGTGTNLLGVANNIISPVWTNIRNTPAGFSDGIDNTEDADSDPANELQALSKTGNVVTLSGNGGGFTDEVNDADTSITNEIQTLDLSGTQLTLSRGGGMVTLPSAGDGDNWGTQVVMTDTTLTGTGTAANPLMVAGALLSPAWNSIRKIPAGFADGIDHVEDADADKTNELQDLQLTGTVLGLTGSGKTVTLPSSGGGDNWGTDVVHTDATLSGNGTTAEPLQIARQAATAGQALKWDGSTWKPASDNVDDADADNTNELQVLSKSGNTVTLSKSGGSFIDAVDDADYNSLNEIQTLSITGSSLSLSKDGGTVALPGDNWGTQSAVTDATLAGNGTAGAPLKLAGQGAASGQVLKFNGTSWIPQPDLAGITTPAGSTGYIQFNSGGNFGGDPSFFWDITGRRLGIRTTSPEYPLHVTSFTDGAGIFASALQTSGWVTAIKGTTQSNSGSAIAGYASNVSGTARGVYGYSESGSGFSGYFEGGNFYVDGNVGIGTNTPASQLDVMGEINLNSHKIINVSNPVNAQDAATKAYVDASGSGSASPGGLSGQVQFNDAGTFGGDSSLFWNNSKKMLGIGTTDPHYPLYVTTKTGVTAIFGKTYVSSGYAAVTGISYSSQSGSGVQGVAEGANSWAVEGIARSATGPTIGVFGQTSSPDGMSLVGSALATQGQAVGVYGTSKSPSGIGVSGHNFSSSGTSYGVRGSVSSPDGYSGYFTGGRFYAEGNVGIGTMNPSTKLDVIGNAGITGTLSVNGTVHGGGYIQSAGSLNGYSLEVGGPDPSGTNGQATIYLHHHERMAHQLRYTLGTLVLEGAGNGYGTTSTPGLQVDGGLFAAVKGGNVGIGTNTPASKLDVKGEVNVNNNKILNVANPVNAQDAATKAYVDASGGIGGSGEANFIPLFTGAKSLGKSNIQYSSEWSGCTGINANPAGMDSRFVAQNLVYLGGTAPTYLARFTGRTATMPPVTTDYAYIKSNGDAYFKGDVTTGGSLTTEGTLTIGNSLPIVRIGEIRYQTENETFSIPIPSGWNCDNIRIITAEYAYDDEDAWYPLRTTSSSSDSYVTYVFFDSGRIYVYRKGFNGVRNYRFTIMELSFP